MGWLTATWLCIASVCLTIAAINAFAWIRQRDMRANAAFAVLSASTAAMAILETRMFTAASTAEYGRVLYWFHVPVWFGLLSAVAFVRLYLKAGAPWLAWTAVALRTVALVINLFSEPNLNFAEITALHRVTLLGETVAVGRGPMNPLVIVGQLSLLVFAVFAVNAATAVWRRGDRRRALTIGGGMVIFALSGFALAVSLFTLDFPLPIVIAIFFLPVVAAMGFELSLDLLRAAQLSVKLAETSAELRDAEARWNFALEGSAQGVWDWDIAGRRAWYSPLFRRMVGGDAVAPTPEPDGWSARVHPDDLAAVRQALDRHFAGETPAFESEFRLFRPDGGEIWTQCRGMVVERDADGRPQRMIGTLSDIGARKATEIALAESRSLLVERQRQLEERTRQVELLNIQLEKRAMDAETATRAKDAFLRNATHELRTPLNHILGGADLLQRGTLDERQSRWARAIQQASRDLLQLVNGILDVARIEAGEVKLESREFSPATVIDEVRLMLLPRAQAKGLSLTAQAGPDVQLRVIGDPTRLAQALLNYVDNGIKFTDRGEVAISARALATDGEGVLVHFEVRDTGVGIPPERKTDLFKAFTQLDPSTTRRQGGLGIGLANVLELSRLMGGTVGVDSTPGRGSIFWLAVRFRRPAPGP